MKHFLEQAVNKPIKNFFFTTTSMNNKLRFRKSLLIFAIRTLIPLWWKQMYHCILRKGPSVLVYVVNKQRLEHSIFTRCNETDLNQRFLSWFGVKMYVIFQLKTKKYYFYHMSPLVTSVIPAAFDDKGWGGGGVILYVQGFSNQLSWYNII